MLSSPRSCDTVAAFPAMESADQWEFIDIEAPSPPASSTSASSSSSTLPSSSSSSSLLHPASLSRPASLVSIPSSSSSSSLLPAPSLEVIVELEKQLADAKLANAQLLEDNLRLNDEVSSLKGAVVQAAMPVIVEEQAGVIDAELKALRLQRAADQARINELLALILRIENARMVEGDVPHSRRALVRLQHATRRSAYEAPVSSRVARRGLKGAPISAMHRGSHSNASRAPQQRTSR